MLTTINDDPDLLKKIITGDESWVHGYDFEASRGANIEKSTSSSAKYEGFAHCFLRLQWRGASWILATSRTVNKEYYLEVMAWLREVFRQKCTELWKNKSWILHHDNAPAHTSILVPEFFAKNLLTSIDVWADALSWYKIHDWFFNNSVCFWRIA